MTSPHVSTVRCWRCGYELVTLGVCPECGAANDAIDLVTRLRASSDYTVPALNAVRAALTLQVTLVPIAVASAIVFMREAAPGTTGFTLALSSVPAVLACGWLSFTIPVLPRRSWRAWLCLVNGLAVVLGTGLIAASVGFAGPSGPSERVVVAMILTTLAALVAAPIVSAEFAAHATPLEDASRSDHPITRSRRAARYTAAVCIPVVPCLCLAPLFLLIYPVLALPSFVTMIRSHRELIHCVRQAPA